MKINTKQKGQTLIETAIILFLLLLILLGITEFARAWYTKNSLKNAVRHGARIAVVTSGISNNNNTSTKAGIPTNCEAQIGNDKVFCYMWNSPGIPDGTTATLTITDDNGDGTLPSSGDTVTVSATTTFNPVIGGSPWPWPDSINMTTDASMRYE